jgi:hypothetical protein
VLQSCQLVVDISNIAHNQLSPEFFWRISYLRAEPDFCKN